MNPEPITYRSHGKLLITSEYLVLDGAKALAVPTKFGQTLKIKPNFETHLHWKSFDKDGNIWFSSNFNSLSGGLIKPCNNIDIANRLAEILNAAKSLNPNFLSESTGLYLESHLEFPRDWGLGSSSTLISNISEWAEVDPYKLLDLTFGGSGYDIACASSNKALVYQLLNENKRNVLEVNFNPKFSKNIYFVYLNQKQNSREGILRYRANTQKKAEHIKAVNQMTEAMIDCESLATFQKLIDEHERLISEIIGLKPVKEKLFSDFKGSIKSLGAWGGDFVMVACENSSTDYFRSKGYDTVIGFEDMVLG